MMGPPLNQNIASKLKREKEADANYERELMKAMTALGELEKRHRVLVDDFEVLSEKYIYTKRCALDAAWRFIPAHSQEFSNSLPKASKFKESDTQIGAYKLGSVIGSGQFSTVNRCISPEGGAMAIKRIKKDQIRSADGVLRVDR
jgi:hypothetical protein